MTGWKTGNAIQRSYLRQAVEEECKVIHPNSLWNCVDIRWSITVQPKKMQLTQEQYLLFERKQFEFGFMPKRFFAQGKQMMDDLCEKKEEYMDQFFEECYQQKRMYPYLPEDFSVMVMDLSDSLLIVRVDLPVRDMGVPSCFRVYFAWNDETQEGRYFTIERTQDPGKHLLGEFKKDGKHVDDGEAPAEGAELQRVLDIIRQPGEN